MTLFRSSHQSITNSIQVVLANGTIANVSETHNPDLYFALRGGGNNFGIVTAFAVRTFSQGPIYTSMTTYSANQSEHALDKIYDLHANASVSSDKDMTYDLHYAYNYQSDEFSLSGTQRYAKPIQNPSVFQAINRIPTVSRNTNIALLSEAVDSTDSMGTIRYFQLLCP